MKFQSGLLEILLMEEFEVLQFYFTQEYKFQVLPQQVTSFRKSNLLNKFHLLSHLTCSSKHAAGVQENTWGEKVIEMKVPPCGKQNFKSLIKSGADWRGSLQIQTN